VAFLFWQNEASNDKVMKSYGILGEAILRKLIAEIAASGEIFVVRN